MRDGAWEGERGGESSEEWIERNRGMVYILSPSSLSSSLPLFWHSVFRWRRTGWSAMRPLYFSHIPLAQEAASCLLFLLQLTCSVHPYCLDSLERGAQRKKFRIKMPKIHKLFLYMCMCVFIKMRERGRERERWNAIQEVTEKGQLLQMKDKRTESYCKWQTVCKRVGEQRATPSERWWMWSHFIIVLIAPA